MVTLSTVQTSNESISETLPPGRIAIFVGATSGIGRASLIHYAKHAPQPRIYFIGRSQQAADEISKQLQETNPEGSYTFIKADAGLLKNVDEVCEQIKDKEESISLLFQSQGTLDMSTRKRIAVKLTTELHRYLRSNTMIETTEKLPLITALGYYSRMRFVANLLPLLQKSPSPSTVISVLSGTKEGPIDPKDIAGKNVKPWNARGHISSLSTLTFEHFADIAPEVTFIYSYPGFVDTPIGNSMKGLAGAIMRGMFTVYRAVGPKLPYVSFEETGERYTFLATGSRFPSKQKSKSVSQHENEVAVGSDGKLGSGVYTLDEACESGDAKVQKILQGLREAELGPKIWEHLQAEFKRITGKESI